MARVRLSGRIFRISQFVFDKDGLLFKSQPFWSELARVRYELLAEIGGQGLADKWADAFGVSVKNGEIVYTDPSGIFAVASPKEESAVTAGLLAVMLRLPWSAARELSESVFQKADKLLSLERALVPAPGFPEIFARLKYNGIPFCIATSDTKQRVIDSFSLFHLYPPEIVVAPDMVNNGKPAPDMLRLIEHMSGVPASETAMVGDSYVDMQMASCVGAIGIGIPETPEMRKAMMPYASVIIDSLNEIEILEDIT